MTAPEPARRLSAGTPELDVLLGGGYETDGLTMLYGEGGTGKTILCIDAAVRVARDDRWVVYIDTEGVSPDRVAQASGSDPSRVLARWLLSSPRSIEEQTEAVRTGCALVRDGTYPVGLIVLDSAALYYRLSIGTDDVDDVRGELLRQLAELLSTSIHAQVPVLFTNQVWRNVETGSLEPIGGTFLLHVAKTVLRIERGTGDRRRAVLVKHRSLPEASAEFRITSEGVSSLSASRFTAPRNPH